MILTAAQLRAARGLLDWTRTDLAKAASISPETVKNIEHGTFRPQEQTADAIIQAFALHDVRFTENEGVQRNRELVKTFIGHKGYLEFLDDICVTMQNGGRTCQFNYSDNIISNFGKERIEQYIQTMQSVPNLDARCLIPEGDVNFPVKHCTYRWLKTMHKNTIPYYLYGSKLAMLAQGHDAGSDKDMVWVSINSETLAATFLRQFDAYWKEAEPVPTAARSR